MTDSARTRDGNDMQLGGLHHVALPVPDLDRSLAWYEQVLGADILRRTDVDERDLAAGRTRQVWLAVGEVVVNLAEAALVRRQPEQHFFHYALQGEPGCLDGWMSHLNEHDVAVLGPYGHGGLSFLSLYFDDPDGYRWEVIIDYPDFASAKAAAQAHGGALGNPTSAYGWDD